MSTDQTELSLTGDPETDEAREHPENGFPTPDELADEHNQDALFGEVKDMGPTDEFDLF